MTAKKMLVLTLAKTKAVLGAATRAGAGVPAATELVGSGLVVRSRIANSVATVVVPADEIQVTEIDYSSGEVFADPMGRTLEATGTIVIPNFGMDSVALTPPNLVVKVKAPTTSPKVPANKVVMVVVDAGPNRDPLKFFGLTTADQDTTNVPVSGVPPGTHLVLSSVDGYGARLDEHTFN